MKMSKNIKKIKKLVARISDSPARTIVLGFAGIILVGAIMLTLPIASKDNQSLHFLDALFMSTSAVCVTGLAAVDPGVQFTFFGQIIMLILIQVGGLGFMTAATLFFVAIGKKVKLQQRLVIRDSFDVGSVKGTVKLINKILKYTFVIELIVACFLMIGFIPEFGVKKGIFYSIFHSVSSFCNAGFDLVNTKNTAFSSLTNLTSNYFILIPIMINIFLGGLGFTVIEDITKKITKKKRRIKTHTKVVILTSLILTFISTLIFLIIEWSMSMKSMNPAEKITNSFFQATASRTAGFMVVDQLKMHPVSRIITMILMFIGASPASTGGGIKTTTFAILIIAAYKTIIGKDKIHYSKKKIDDQLIKRAIAIFAFAASLIILIVMLIALIETKALNKGVFDLEAILFEGISAFTTTGYSYGITPVLKRASRFCLTILIFVGRCGPLTIGTAFILNNTKGKYTKLDYPDSKIRLG